MSTASRERDRASLKDLARMATTGSMPPPSGPVSSGTFAGASAVRDSRPPEPEREENSGVINLAALAASEPVAATEAADTRSAHVAPQDATAIAPASVPAPVPLPAVKTATGTRKTGSAGWRALGGMVAAAAVAAGVFFGMHRTTHDGSVAVTSAPAAADAPARAIATSTTASTPIAPEERGIDPSTLPPAQAQAAAHAAPQAMAAGGSAPKAASLSPAPVAPAPPPAADPALAATIPAPAQPPAPAPNATEKDKSLEALMQQAAGVTSSPTAAAAPAADAPLPAAGSVPLKPSLGAIQGALGAALPGARACLGPDDAISHATVTFKSDGSVGSVAVSGGAAGKPAEACIRSALSKARVQPFAQPSFSAPATVRPN